MKSAAAALATLAVLAAPGMTHAQDEPDALAILRHAAEALAAAETFSVTAGIAHDAVLDSGFVVTSFAIQEIHVHRPDRMRVSITRDDGTRREYFFDGSAITLVEPDEAVFATTPAGPTIDDAQTVTVDELDVALPMSVLVRADLAEQLPLIFHEVSYLGERMIRGEAQHHIAASNEAVDAQIWISAGERPELRRVSIVYRDVFEAPRFTAQFVDWTYAEPAQAFAFTPTDAYEQIEFQETATIEEASE